MAKDDARSALGWRSHSGWAVFVGVRGPSGAPRVLTKGRTDLVDASLPNQPYHAAVEDGMSLRDARALIARVRRSAVAAATTATKNAVRQFGVATVGVIARARNIPENLDRILASHTLLHAAEGALFEEVFLDAAARVGVACVVVEPERIDITQALDEAGKTLGPPWRKDHKLAAAVALLALEQ